MGSGHTAYYYVKTVNGTKTSSSSQVKNINVSGPQKQLSGNTLLSFDNKFEFEVYPNHSIQRQQSLIL